MGANDSARRIAILANNPETLHGLEGYLRHIGLPAESRRSLDIADLDAGTTRAVVLFPDDFPEANVRVAMQALLRQHGNALKLIITGRPAAYEAILGNRAGFVVVARPVWGWAIVDAIRLHEEISARPNEGQKDG